MAAPDILETLQALGVRLSRDGDALIAEPRSALTEAARAMIRAHKAELLAELNQSANGTAEPNTPDRAAEARKARALAYLEAHAEASRACFADVDSDPAHIVLTVALREPWGAVEVLVKRERFDAMALMGLSLRYPGTSVFVPVH